MSKFNFDSTKPQSWMSDVYNHSLGVLRALAVKILGTTKTQRPQSWIRNICKPSLGVLRALAVKILRTTKTRRPQSWILNICKSSLGVLRALVGKKSATTKRQSPQSCVPDVYNHSLSVLRALVVKKSATTKTQSPQNCVLDVYNHSLSVLRALVVKKSATTKMQSPQSFVPDVYKHSFGVLRALVVKKSATTKTQSPQSCVPDIYNHSLGVLRALVVKKSATTKTQRPLSWMLNVYNHFSSALEVKKIRPRYALFTMFLFAFVIPAIAQDSLDFSQQVETRKVLNNSLANSSFTPYRPFKTRTLSSLSGFKTKVVKLDKYGGRTDKSAKATGFYYTKKINGRWWAIDPAGHLFLHNALNAVSMGASDRNKAAFATQFKDENTWITQTQNMMLAHGFNGAGAWSNAKVITNSPLQATKPLAYTINLDFMSAYGDKRGGTFQVPGHKGYPNNVIFVFDPAFEAFCDQQAKKLVANKTDANLFGYFSDNEMPLGIKNLDGYLTLKNQEDPGYLAAKKWIDAKGVAADKITDEHRLQFLTVVADRYFSIVSKAIKKYDPNHMYLGCRYHGKQGFIEELWRVAGKYIDAISMNYYNAWTPDQALMAKWTNWSGKPFIITEWYVKGDDSGLGNTAGAGWVVKTQADRGLFYQNFTLGLLESKNCVGWHWFKYMDNDPTQKGAEPSNTNANKGIIDNEYQLYLPLVNKMKELNFQMYQLADFFDRAK